MIQPTELIRRKRDGGELGRDELTRLVLAYARDEIPEYQMAAFLMAVYFRGLSRAETRTLTRAMVASGETLTPGRALGRPVADKHSTGGVGDKVSIALGPVVAACGIPFAKMSGRGLGHTGGTVDKLEAIPGFRTELSASEFSAQLRQVNLAIVAQSAALVPADRKLYELRDMTATVEDHSLIAASVMSKKIAAGADAILLDVKVGEGAFARTLDEARALAATMRGLGVDAGRRVVCLLTAMEQPLGAAVGNALEVREAVGLLRGLGPSDLHELVVAEGAALLALCDPKLDESEALRVAERVVADGSALAAYERWIVAQGGDPDEDALPTAPRVVPVIADRAGYVGRLRAREIASAVIELSGARRGKDDTLDPAVGVVCQRKLGDHLVAGEPLALVHARDRPSAQAAAASVRRAYSIVPETPTSGALILGRVD